MVYQIGKEQGGPEFLWSVIKAIVYVALFLIGVFVMILLTWR